MMPRLSLSIALPLALAGCATLPADGRPSGQSLTWLRFGQSAHVAGPAVTPLRLLEDSRCPLAVRCVWAGRVRILVRVHSIDGIRLIELATGRPVAVADGTLELAEVRPPRRREAAIPPRDYRLGFRFRGGL